MCSLYERKEDTTEHVIECGGENEKMYDLKDDHTKEEWLDITKFTGKIKEKDKQNQKDQKKMKKEQRQKQQQNKKRNMKRDNNNRKEERKVDDKRTEIQIIIKEDQVAEDKNDRRRSSDLHNCNISVLGRAPSSDPSEESQV